MMREFIDYLNDILIETNRIHKFIMGVSFKEFSENDEKVFAVSRSLEIIGEAVKKIPEDVRSENSSINWQEIAKMPDKLIHYYYAADEKIIWDTAKKDIPELAKKVKKLIETLKP